MRRGTAATHDNGRVLIAHLSDLHLRHLDDVSWLDRQLTRIVARRPAHLAITGDLLDRWDRALLDRTLDTLQDHGLLDAEQLTLLHGNHDLASSGGHPRQNADLIRLGLRFWDPPPLVRWRRRRFYASVAARAQGIAQQPPWVKHLHCGLRIAVIDTVPIPWRPFMFERGAVTVHHAMGRVRPVEAEWLATQRGELPLVVLAHHYPLDTPTFTWTPERQRSRAIDVLGKIVREVRVPMAIPARDRERFWKGAHRAGVRLVLCGHVHRARLEWRDGIAVGLNGQSGADWAGRTVAFYELGDTTISRDSEQIG